MKARIVLAAVLLGLALFMGCQSVPTPKSADDCLVVIKTEMNNPKNVEMLRKYQYNLSGGYKWRIADRNFTLIQIKEPGIQVDTISSYINESNAVGNTSKDEVKLPLPYMPGRLVIADFVMILIYKQIDDTHFQSGYKLRNITTKEKEDMLASFKSNKGYAKWFE
jgi:hypothetical protein